MKMNFKKAANPGNIAFMIGIFGALLLGLLSGLGVFSMTNVYLVFLVLVGIAIGLMNITDSEAVPLMIASLVIGAGAGGLAVLPFGSVITSMLTTLAVVILPAAIVVAIKVVLDKSR